MSESHLQRNAWCKACRWIGETGELIASGRPGGLRCPTCDSDDIYVGQGRTQSERLENLKSAFAEHGIPWPTAH